MNHVYGKGESPFDNEIKERMMECPHCLGTREEFESTDEEGLSGDMITCRVCDGYGEISAQDGYTPLENFRDEEADNSRENYMLEDEKD